MVNESDFRKVIDDDLMKLKFLLKSKVASLDEIKKEEQAFIDHVKTLIASVRQMEETLEKEIDKYKRFTVGWEKVYAKKKWDLLGQAIREEVDNFNQEYAKTKDVYELCTALNQRLESLRETLRKMNARNKEAKEKELALLEDFRKQKTGGTESYDL